MKNAYLAICYICNENCRFCPCSKNEKIKKVITGFSELKDTVDAMNESGITDITISGGEPTLHPNLIELIKYIQRLHINVTLLSKSERFANKDFINDFINNIDVKSLKVITTLHSHKCNEHEAANQTLGSFRKSIDGLLNLSANNIRVIIKHCITKANYKDLCEFYEFCDSTFKYDADIQLCSIDYCGIPSEKMQEEKLLFTDLRPHLEKLFDLHIEKKKNGICRSLYCINMPLCSCDVYYWNYIPRRRDKMYNQYKDPHSKNLVDVSNNVGIHQDYCADCKVVALCNGTYFTAYETFGAEIIQPYT